MLENPNVLYGPVEFSRPGFAVSGCLARPKAGGRHPAVLVVAGKLITEEAAYYGFLAYTRKPEYHPYAAQLA